MGEVGCLSLFGEKPKTHHLSGEHLVAEYRVKTKARGRSVDEWKQRPERGDNHWFDGMVGCAVAASIQGVSLPGAGNAPRPARERLTMDEMKRRSRQHRQRS